MSFVVVEITSERTVVVDGTPTYEVELRTAPAYTVEVATHGLQGPAGPQGPQGPAGTSYTPYVYDRAGVPAATWTITHGLGRHVHVTVLDTDGDEVTTDVDHSPDLNTITLTFAAPTTGMAIIG